MLFRGLVKTAFNLSRKNFFLTKIVLFKSFSLFNETFFGFLFEKFRKVRQNCVFRVQRNILQFFCRKKTLSILFIIGTMAEFYRQAWQNWILSVHGNFLKDFDSAKKTSFFMVSGHRAKPTRRFEEVFSAGLSKLHLRVPEKHFDWTQSLKKLIFTITLGHWEKKFQLFDKRFSTGFQRSLSTCPGKHFEEYF